jgi:putative transposase
VDREFRPQRPNEVWASDATYIATAEGWLYLFVIIDLYSRRVVGWAMSKSLATQTLLQAFWTALARRGAPKGLIFHSDRAFSMPPEDFETSCARSCSSRA